MSENKTINQSQVPHFPSLQLIAKNVVEGFIVGMHKSPFHGFSVEFSEHRHYNQGESTRHIDWKLYGRTDRLYVKRFEEETNLRCQIVIDMSNSMFFPFMKNVDIENPNKAVFSIYAAATLMNILQRQRDAVGLTFFDEQIKVHTQAKSNAAHYRNMITELSKLLINADITKHQDTNIADSLHFVAENVHKRSMIVIFSDMFDSGEDTEKLFDSLQHLKYNKHEVILFHVNDKKLEIDFDFQNRPHRFIDMETGETIKLHPKEIQNVYSKRVSNFKKEIEQKCAQYNIDFVETDINKGLKEIILPFLLKRNKMN